MGCLEGCFANLASKLVEVVAPFLCRPCYEECQNIKEVLSSPGSFDNYLNQLEEMAIQIRAMSSSGDIVNWISDADKILEDKRLPNLNDGQQSRCFSGDACFRCKMQKKIKKMILRGNGIIARANRQKLPVKPFPEDEVPRIDDDSVAGRNLRRVMDILKDNDVSTIGIWGPGGVGKTTLAKALNNKLEGTSLFRRVIFVQLTKDDDVKSIIAQKLRLGENVEGMDVAEKIRNTLKKEKFLLILDNVWKDINLLSIGIPQKQEHSKIVLTTRLLEVCQRMDAKTLKIEYLTHDEAWQLFTEKAGDVVNKREIEPLAQIVCQKCGGLPLALVAVGSTMRGKMETYQWESAITKLQRPITIYGVDSEVYRALMLSYEWLDDDLKLCFLYCSLHPEGYYIPVSHLIQCWLAEKLIDEKLYYVNAFSRGLDLIKKLIDSCLLEEWSLIVGELDSVKMHDVVRDFARWILEERDGKSIIFSGHGKLGGPVVILPELEKAKNFEWISFVDNEKIELPQRSMDFPKVTTILFRRNRNYENGVSQEFLKGFRSLRVLYVQSSRSFSCSNLCFPELRAIFLRRCDDVEEIPCTSKLMILDLSESSLCDMPRGVKKLIYLKVLNLSFTRSLKSMDVEIISNMLSLEYLDTRESGYKWPTKRKFNSKEATLQDLSGLKELKSIYLDLADVECSYEDCDWMVRLENFIYGYDSESRESFWGSDYVRIKGKGIHINGNRCTQVGSFIFYAEELVLVYFQNLIFINFNLIDQSKSKLKDLAIGGCSLSEGLTRLASSPFALSNLECLTLCSNNYDTSFSQLANTLGTPFPKLRRLEGYGDYEDDDGEEYKKLKNFFSSNDPHIEFPNLEEIVLKYHPNMTEMFDYGPTEKQAIAPILRKLTLFDLPSLERLCYYELIEQWQSLEFLCVRRCFNLKKLPPMTSIKEIRGGERWWNNLEWDSPETKSYMDRFFKPLSIRDLDY